MARGVVFVAIVLVAGALWDFFTTLYGLASYFDLPLNPGVNPVQFTFALVLSAIVFSFVIATHLIWSIKHEDFTVLMLKAAWGVCIAINLIASWQGTKYVRLLRRRWRRGARNWPGTGNGPDCLIDNLFIEAGSARDLRAS